MPGTSPGMTQEVPNEAAQALPAPRMRLPPMPCDVEAAAEPDLVVALDMVEEALQRRKAAGAADEAAMEADRQHLRRACALLVEHVEGVAQIREELVAGIEALARRKAHVVGIERVGH